MTAWVYGIANRTGDESYDWLVLVVLAAQPIVGLLVGRWWVALLPLAVVAISVPAGYPPVEGVEPLPLWFGLAFGLVFAVPLVIAGIVARKIYERRQATAAIT